MKEPASTLAILVGSLHPSMVPIMVALEVYTQLYILVETMGIIIIIIILATAFTGENRVAEELHLAVKNTRFNGFPRRCHESTSASVEQLLREIFCLQNV